MNRFFRNTLFFVAVALTMSGCKVKYSFTGASIAPEVKTFSVQQFQNNAEMVAPLLATLLTEGLTDRFIQQTRLMPVKEDGDFAFEGNITNYTSTSIAVAADEYATMNRLTITINVIFTNKIDPKSSFTRSFSRFEDYDSGIPLQTAEQSLLPNIVKQLVTDLFNASASNW